MGGGVEVEAKEGGGGQTMVKTGVGGPRRPGIAVLARPLVLRGGRRGARGRARRALGSRDGGGGGCAGGGLLRSRVCSMDHVLLWMPEVVDLQVGKTQPSPCWAGLSA